MTMTATSSQAPLPNYAVVIPAYNEAATIHDIVGRALKICNIVIVVDDGSTDNTSAALADLNATLIKHTQNRGKAASLLDGIHAAISMGVDYIVTLDGDGQHHPEDINRLLHGLNDHPNSIIIGSRLANKAAIPAKRYYANKTANFWLSWATGYLIEDSQSGFRVYPSDLFNGLSISTKHGFVFESEILIKAAKRNVYSYPVPIEAIYSVNARPSHFHGIKDITLITLMVTKELVSHAMAPIRFYRAFLKPLFLNQKYDQMRIDGIAMLLLSLLIVVFTGGISLIPFYLYILLVGKAAKTLCPTDGIRVVLGLQLVNNKPSNEYILRLKRTLSCLFENPESKAIILGGITGNANVSEAAAGRDWLVSNGISEQRLLIEKQSRNTLENLKLAKSQLGHVSHPVVLISHRYHLPRAAVLANGLSIRNTICAADDAFNFTSSNLINIFKEALNLHWYFTGRTFARLTKNKKMLARLE